MGGPGHPVVLDPVAVVDGDQEAKDQMVGRLVPGHQDRGPIGGAEKVLADVRVLTGQGGRVELGVVVLLGRRGLLARRPRRRRLLLQRLIQQALL